MNSICKKYAQSKQDENLYCNDNNWSQLPLLPFICYKRPHDCGFKYLGLVGEFGIADQAEEMIWLQDKDFCGHFYLIASPLGQVFLSKGLGKVESVSWGDVKIDSSISSSELSIFRCPGQIAKEINESDPLVFEGGQLLMFQQIANCNVKGIHESRFAGPEHVWSYSIQNVRFQECGDLCMILALNRIVCSKVQAVVAQSIWIDKDLWPKSCQCLPDQNWKVQFLKLLTQELCEANQPEPTKQAKACDTQISRKKHLIERKISGAKHLLPPETSGSNSLIFRKKKRRGPNLAIIVVWGCSQFLPIWVPPHTMHLDSVLQCEFPFTWWCVPNLARLVTWGCHLLPIWAPRHMVNQTSVL